MLEDARELEVVEHPALDGRLPVHLVDLLVGEPVADGGQQLAEAVLVDHPGVVVVEATERVLDHVLGVGACEEEGINIVFNTCRKLSVSLTVC